MRARVRISYTQEKYLTITSEDDTAKPILDRRAENFLLRQKTVVNSSDKNCKNLNKLSYLFLATCFL